MKQSILFAATLLLLSASTTFAATVDVDFATSTRTVSADFYGAQVRGWGGQDSYIDANGDRLYETASDYNAHRAAMQAAKLGYLRRDMGLEYVANSEGTFKTALFSNYANINVAKSQVAWAAQNNMKILFTAGRMPSWLADNAANCATNTILCGPKDYNRWGALVVDFLDEVTLNGKYASAVEVEVWNEPYNTGSLAPLATIQERTNEYIAIYRATRNAVKAKYPNIKVGGPSGWYGSGDGTYLTNTFLSTFPSSEVDFVSLHEYGDATLANEILTGANNVIAKGHKKEIKITEYNSHTSSALVNQPKEHSVYLAQAIAGVLNSQPIITTMSLYQWAETTKYSFASPAYSQWPLRFSMYAEPKLDNTKYASFFVYKDFGTYHPRGATIVKSTSSDSKIKAVGSTHGGGQYITLINLNSVSTSIQLDLSGISATSVADQTSGSNYAVVNGVATFSLAPMSVVHYKVSSGAPPAAPLNPPPSGGEIIWEAESGSISSPMQAVRDSDASGGWYVTAANAAVGAGKTSYYLTVPSSGAYILWARVLASNGDDDSFFFSMDNNNLRLWDVVRSADWVWEAVDERDGADPVYFNFNAGTHFFTLTNREDNTQVDSFLLTTNPSFVPSGANGLGGSAGTSKQYIWLEAERPDILDSPMQRASDANAAGGSYVYTPIGASGGKATFLVNIPTSGDYTLWGRVLTPDAMQDSFVVQVNEGKDYIWDTSRGNVWLWDAVSDRNGADPLVLKLSSGAHRIEIKNRESGTKIDKLLLTNDPAYLPSGYGGAASN